LPKFFSVQQGQSRFLIFREDIIPSQCGKIDFRAGPADTRGSMEDGMRHRGKFATIAFLLLLLPASAVWAGNVNLIGGKRWMTDDSLWKGAFQEPVDEQNVYGVNVDWAPEEWPVSLLFGAFVSTEDGVIPDSMGPIDTDVEILELSFGLIHTWQGHKMLRPYIGGGLSSVIVELDASQGSLSEKFDDNSFGFFFTGGLYLRLGKHFNVGLDGRFLYLTDLNIEGQSFDADYLQLGLLVGWHW
jgi:hypothetical protein